MRKFVQILFVFLYREDHFLRVCPINLRFCHTLSHFEMHKKFQCAEEELFNHTVITFKHESITFSLLFK